MGVNEAVGSGTSLAVGSTELQLRSHDDQQATADSLSGRIIAFHQQIHVADTSHVEETVKRMFFLFSPEYECFIDLQIPMYSSKEGSSSPLRF